MSIKIFLFCKNVTNYFILIKIISNWKFLLIKIIDARYLYISKTYKRNLVHLLILQIYKIACCTRLFQKNDVYAKYINLEKSGLKIQKKEKETLISNVMGADWSTW